MMAFDASQARAMTDDAVAKWESGREQREAEKLAAYESFAKAQIEDLEGRVKDAAEHGNSFAAGVRFDGRFLAYENDRKLIQSHFGSLGFATEIISDDLTRLNVVKISW